MLVESLASRVLVHVFEEVLLVVWLDGEPAFFQASPRYYMVLICSHDAIVAVVCELWAFCLAR